MCKYATKNATPDVNRIKDRAARRQDRSRRDHRQIYQNQHWIPIHSGTKPVAGNQPRNQHATNQQAWTTYSSGRAWKNQTNKKHHPGARANLEREGKHDIRAWPTLTSATADSDSTSGAYLAEDIVEIEQNTMLADPGRTIAAETNRPEGKSPAT